MTKIYIVRHCETVGNAVGLLQGSIDLDISELGAAQLAALSDRFASVPLDAIISSPLKRTRRTAAAINGTRDIPIIINPNIIELNCGIYEGKRFEEIAEAEPEFADIWCSRPWDFDPVGGEKMVSAYERIWLAVRQIAKEYDGKTVALSTHGAVSRLLLCRILKGDITRLNEIPYGSNTAVSLLELDGELNVRIVCFNDDSHLTDDLKNPAAAVPKRL